MYTRPLLGMVLLTMSIAVAWGQDDRPANSEAASAGKSASAAQEMRQRFIELARQRAEQMNAEQLQRGVAELSRELQEGEAEKTLAEVDRLLSHVIERYPDTFAARRAASALVQLRAAPTRLAPRQSARRQTETTDSVEQIIDLDALRRRVRTDQP